MSLLTSSSTSSSSTITNIQQEYSDYLTWQSNQGYIVTGGNKLSKTISNPNDYTSSDLPHYNLTNKSFKKHVKEWQNDNKISKNLIGIWSRPIFLGGWKESSTNDTQAYNIQSPSLFIDMRIPTKRNDIYSYYYLENIKNNINKQRNILYYDNIYDQSSPSNLFSFSWNELKILSRQHCFSGYTLPLNNDNDIVSNNTLTSASSTSTSSPSPSTSHGPLFVRHHLIDWNFHPLYPRPQPNAWWIEAQGITDEEPLHNENNEKMTLSFKEHSYGRDKYNVPVYMERWQRRLPYQNQTKDYLVLWKLPKLCSGESASLTERRASVLIIIGSHFIFTQDRDHLLPKPTDKAFNSSSSYSPSLHWLFSHYNTCQQCLTHLKSNCNGGGGSFVDYLSKCSENPSKVGCKCLNSTHYYHLAQQYIDVEGSYGIIVEENNEYKFKILDSTFPWLINTNLFTSIDNIELNFNDNNELSEFSWTLSSNQHLSSIKKFNPFYRRSCYGHHINRWEILHNTFDKNKLLKLFNNKTKFAKL